MKKIILFILISIFLINQVFSISIKSGEGIKLVGYDLSWGWDVREGMFDLGKSIVSSKSSHSSLSFNWDITLCLKTESGYKVLWLCPYDTSLFYDLGVTDIDKSSADAFKECDDKQYSEDIRVFSGHTYCVITKQKNYAKLKIVKVQEGYREPDWPEDFDASAYSIVFNYVYEPNRLQEKVENNSISQEEKENNKGQSSLNLSPYLYSIFGVLAVIIIILLIYKIFNRSSHTYSTVNLKKHCNKCGRKLTPSDTFCENCGHKVK